MSGEYEALRAAVAERREQVAEMYEAGVPLREMAEILDVGVSLVSMDAARLREDGLVGRRYAPRGEA